MYKGSILGVPGSSHNFCPKKQGSLGEYQHCPSSFNKSAVPSFNNAILLRSSQNGLLVDYKSRSLILGSQKLHPCKPGVVIDYYQCEG
ncbi:hypothetical protein Tco_0354532, partial [Tanacetum coccineum]